MSPCEVLPVIAQRVFMKISIIVPCRNEKRHIGKFVDSVLAQELDPGCDMEILIADGMSDDGTREELISRMARCQKLRMIDNPGRVVSTGLNAAIEASTGDIIVRMDVHTTYAADYVRQCVEILNETGADNVGGPWIARGEGRVGQAIAAAFQSPFCAGGGKAHDPTYEGEVDTVYLGCWRRSVFERAGTFDPTLVRNQDDEYNFRLLRRGGRIWQSPRIQSSYVVRASIGRLFRQYMQYGYWKVAVIRKHGAVASWRHAVPPLFVGSTVLALLIIAGALGTGMPAVAQTMAVALAAVWVVYFAGCAGAALFCRHSVQLRSLVLVPVVIAVHHIAYGTGFLVGLMKPAPSGVHGSKETPLFTSLTR